MSLDVVTSGCRLNITESEVIRRQAAAAGLSDAVVFNTCAVTGEAVRQARQAIRKLRRERPQTRLVVTGWAGPTEAQTFLAVPEVDRTLGNDAKFDPAVWGETARLFQQRGGFGLADEERAVVNDIMAVKET